MASKLVQVENFTGSIEFDLSKTIRDNRVMTTFVFTNPNKFQIVSILVQEFFVRKFRCLGSGVHRLDSC